MTNVSSKVQVGLKGIPTKTHTHTHTHTYIYILGVKYNTRQCENEKAHHYKGIWLAAPSQQLSALKKKKMMQQRIFHKMKLKIKQNFLSSACCIL